MRVLDDAPWEALARRPKWLVGFSDVTALHAMAWAAGVCSVHGPNVTALGRDASPVVRAAWLACVEGPPIVGVSPSARGSQVTRVWRGLRVLRSGAASGPVVGGNLSLLHAMAAAGRLALPEGAVLALEDVTEAPYRVDRMLTSLRLSGVLQRASAIVFGGFDRCSPGPDGRTVEEVLAERTVDLGIPVLAGAPFGHASHNEAFVLGRTVRIEGDSVLF
jgi:muramoyltetrapeptide carboxypeptidase